MKKIALISSLGALLGICCSCNKELLHYEAGDLRVSVEEGDEWLHDFPLFMGIKRKNAPQVAVWVEDQEGHYISTVYVSHKIAKQAWMASGGNRRKEALPHWCYSRGVKYDDGLYLPTKSEPLTDGVTGATPQGSFDVKLRSLSEMKRFVVKMEINHSTDFNDYYPKSAGEGEAGYSGGRMGSGQPALVYAAQVDLESGQKEFTAELIGHSSPDGSNGSISPDLSTLTTALDIVRRVIITIE